MRFFQPCDWLNGLPAGSDIATCCSGMCITSLDFHLDRDGFFFTPLVGVRVRIFFFWNESCFQKSQCLRGPGVSRTSAMTRGWVRVSPSVTSHSRPASSTLSRLSGVYRTSWALMGQMTCSPTELGQRISAPLRGRSLRRRVSVADTEEYLPAPLFVQTAARDGNHCYSSHSG